MFEVLPPNAKVEDELRTLCHAIYALFAVGIILLGIPFLFSMPPVAILLYIIGGIMIYAHRGKAENTWLASHFAWLAGCFWTTIIISILYTGAFLWLILYMGIGLFFSPFTILATAPFFFLGNLILGMGYVAWFIYRVAKGWLRLIEKRAL